MAAQTRGPNKHGALIDDLIDKEMIDLLNVCSQFKCPPISELNLVTLGLPPTRTKLLVLDMDETLIHSRFLTHQS
jgi:TFIIF-interacting CTD phosphatase-like protein